MPLFAKSPDGPAHNGALAGRAAPIPTAERSFINERPLKGPYPPGLETAWFAMGCFWGVERLFWQAPGVWVTAVGYMGGATPNPTYQEVCSGATGHAEAVQVVFDAAVISYENLLKLFWEGHEPTQGMRQGNDVGSQYRSAIYTASPAQAAAARASLDAYQGALRAAGVNRTITTQIEAAGEFFFAEDYHQQYLAKNPAGYCGLDGTGVACPIGAGVSA